MKVTIKITSLVLFFSVITAVGMAQELPPPAEPQAADLDGTVMAAKTVNMDIAGLNTQQAINELHQVLSANAALNITRLNTNIINGRSAIQYFGTTAIKQAIVTAIQNEGYTVQLL